MMTLQVAFKNLSNDWSVHYCALCSVHSKNPLAMELRLGAKNCKNAHSTPLEAFSVFWFIAQHETTERSAAAAALMM
jgi:hypothetical protein